MLFFKEIMDEKFEDNAFRTFYEKECHLCSKTVKVIAMLEANEHLLSDILDRHQITKQEYEDLKNAEYCNPETVMKLCSILGFPDPDLVKNCPRLK